MFSFRSDDIDDWSTRFVFNGLPDFFVDFDGISDEIDAIFEELEDMQSVIPTSSLRDFESLYSQYVTATEVYLSPSVELGVDYELTVTEPRTIARRANSGTRSRKNRFDKSKMFPKKKPLCDIITSDNDVKIIAELPGVSKEDIKVRVLDGNAEILARKGNTKYNRKVRIPAAVDADSGRSKFNNGILEIIFDKKKKKVQPANQTRKIKNT